MVRAAGLQTELLVDRIGLGATAAETRAHEPGGRRLFIDNVRWTMIVLVLSMHAADTYSPVGNWYYTERPHVGPGVALFFVTYQGVLQAFFMALLFFVAGYFVPVSYDTKGARSFLAGRVYRLGLPTLLYVVVIGPLTEFYVAHSWHTKQSFAHEMVLYFVRGRFLSGTGPMWFCAALLIFSCGYAAWRLSRAALKVSAKNAPAPDAVGVGLAIAALTVSTFAVRIAAPVGMTVFNMQLGDFASYIILFGLGVAARRGAWLERVSGRFAWTTAGLCVGLGMLIWAPLLFFGGAVQGRFPSYAGGLHWQSAALCLWEALICIGMTFGVLATFRAFVGGQGPVTKFLSGNAFAVYVIHPPLLIGLALLLAGVALPPVEKFALLWGLSVLTCFGVAAPLARRIPLVGQILS